MAKQAWFRPLAFGVLLASTLAARGEDLPFKPEWNLETMKLGQMRDAPELFFFWKIDLTTRARAMGIELESQHINLLETIKAPVARRNDAQLEYIDYPAFAKDVRASLVLPISHAQYIAHGTVFRITKFEVGPQMKDDRKVLAVRVLFEQQTSMGGYPVKFVKFSRGLSFCYTTTVEWERLLTFEKGAYFVSVGAALEDIFENLAPYGKN